MGDSHTRCTCNQPLAGSHFADHEVASENNRIILPRTTAPPSLDHGTGALLGVRQDSPDKGVSGRTAPSNAGPRRRGIRGGIALRLGLPGRAVRGYGMTCEVSAAGLVS